MTDGRLPAPASPPARVHALAMAAAATAEPPLEDRWGSFIAKPVEEGSDRYLVYFASIHSDFRLAELKGAAGAEDIAIAFDDAAYSTDVRLRRGEGEEGGEGRGRGGGRGERKEESVWFEDKAYYE